jgi:hypothetical protein
MHPKKLETVFNLPSRERYEYFIKHAADFEEVWGLRQKDGWATTADDNGTIYIPFWPEKEFAELCVTGEWVGYCAESIPLDEFIEDWLPGMDKDNVKASVFPNFTSNNVVIEAKVLLEHLQEELELYE